MNKTLQRIFWIIGATGFAVGLVGLILRFISGHEAANYGSYVPWGLWVGAYSYLLGISAGTFLFSGLIYIFRIQRFERIGKLALLTALVTMITGLLAILVDLGRPERFWRLYVNTNFTSLMGIMVWVYTVYFFVMVIELWFVLRADMLACREEKGLKGFFCRLLTFGKKERTDELVQRDRKVSRILSIIGVLLAVAFAGGSGALFGVVGARPYWHSGLVPIVFLIGGVLSGTALLTFITFFWGTDRDTEEHRGLIYILGRIVLGLLVFDMLLEWADISVSLWNAVPTAAASLRLVLFGQYWWAFWIIHLGLGVLVPLFLLLFWGRRPVLVALGAILIAVTFLTVRLNIIIPGLAVEELRGLSGAFTGPGLNFNYIPSIVEWLVFVWIMSLAGLMFQAGYSMLPIVRTKEVN
jgi:molybdopterin-containing oxidoreductase family membrane subunit